MNDDIPTSPDHSAPTEPAPPLPFGAGERTTARAVIPDDGLTNGAGAILNLLHGGCGGSVGVLWSHAGAYRASHWHREDSHRLYVLEGEVHYYERAVGATDVEIEEVFTGGDMFDTPPNREHLLIFKAPTIMVSMSSRSRTHEEHERDVVRVPRESWNV